MCDCGLCVCVLAARCGCCFLYHESLSIDGPNSYTTSSSYKAFRAELLRWTRVATIRLKRSL
jgi:hypothetical protein